MKILFTDKTKFNRDGITNTWNSHIWSLNNPHASTKTCFQSRFSVNQFIRLFVLEELYLCFLEDAVRQELWLQQDGTHPHFGRQVTAFLSHLFENHWIGWTGRQGLCLATEVTRPNAFRLLSLGMYEVPGVCNKVKH
jgi:hypothetical protein